jgi:NAD(P)-dependent dehydrogenase (short-subunit alcohol dehydrogenase family)
MAVRYFASDLLGGKTALVTGASSGIGAAAARAFGAAGAKVILSGRDGARLGAVCRDIPGATAIAADLARSGEAERLAEQALTGGDLHVLVNSAGYGVTKSSPRLSESEIDGMLAVNVRASLILAARIGKTMQKRGHGSIVNVSSVVAALGTPFQAGYAATKGAVEAFTRSLAREFGPSGVRVNAVAPGLIDTEMWQDSAGVPNFKEETGQGVTLRRWGTPETVADAILFLASDASAYITGEVLNVDGGLVHTGDLIPPRFFGRES